MGDDAKKLPPSFVVPASLDDAGLSVYQFRALAHIARRAGGDGGLFYGSGTKAAAKCGMSHRHWKRCLADLVRMGYLVVMNQETGVRTVYQYRCTIVPTGAPQSPVTGASQSRVGPVVHGTGAPQSPPPGTGRPTYEKESPSRSPLKENSSSSSSEKASALLAEGQRLVEEIVAATDETAETVVRRHSKTAKGAYMRALSAKSPDWLARTVDALRDEAVRLRAKAEDEAEGVGRFGLPTAGPWDRRNERDLGLQFAVWYLENYPSEAKTPGATIGEWGIPLGVDQGTRTRILQRWARTITEAKEMRAHAQGGAA